MYHQLVIWWHFGMVPVKCSIFMHFIKTGLQHRSWEQATPNTKHVTFTTIRKFERFLKKNFLKFFLIECRQPVWANTRLDWEIKSQVRITSRPLDINNLYLSIVNNL